VESRVDDGDAILMAQKAFEISRNNPVSNVVLGTVYSDQGRHDEAIAAYKQAAGAAPAYKWAAARGYVRAGRLREARMVLAELERERITPWTAFWRAQVNAMLGRRDEAFRWLEFRRPHVWVAFVGVWDWFSNLWEDPRILTLTNRMHVAPPIVPARSRAARRRLFHGSEIALVMYHLPESRSAQKIPRWWTRESDSMAVFTETVKMIFYAANHRVWPWG